MSQKIYSDRTEVEGVDLPGAGQTRMLVIDENKKIKSEAKPTIQTPKFDDVLGAGDVTDKEAKFQSEVSTKYSHVSNERVISGDVEKGSYTKIDYEGIEHVPHVGRGRHNVKFTEDVGDGTHTHVFQAKSGTVAHLSDIPNLVYNQNKSNTKTATNTTVSVRMNEATTGSIILTPEMMAVGKTLYFEVMGDTDLTVPDTMSFFISIGDESVEIPIDISTIGGLSALYYNIKGYIDFTGGSYEERGFNFSGVVSVDIGGLQSHHVIPTTTLEIDATSNKGFTIDVKHETTNTTTNCYKSFLKKLN